MVVNGVEHPGMGVVSGRDHLRGLCLAGMPQPEFEFASDPLTGGGIDAELDSREVNAAQVGTSTTMCMLPPDTTRSFSTENPCCIARAGSPPRRMNARKLR